MSYSLKHCRTVFTGDQDARARATLENLRPELINDSSRCADAVPTMTEWSAAVMTLLLLVAGTVVFKALGRPAAA